MCSSKCEGPNQVEQVAEQIKVELLSEIMGVLIMRSRFDDAKLVSPSPFHFPTTTEDLTFCLGRT
jgi:hypothetical protein